MTDTLVIVSIASVAVLIFAGVCVLQFLADIFEPEDDPTYMGHPLRWKQRR